MKALYFDGKLTVRDMPKPQRVSGEALIQVLLAGICGTDREILKGYSGFHGIPGHEFVGRVVECDDQQWLGRRVVGEINLACGHCAWCARGLGRHCPHRTVLGIVNRPGVFAEYVTLPVANLHNVPDNVSDSAATFTEPVAAACEILEQMTIPPGTAVAIIGDGRLGLLVAQVLRHAGAQVTLIGRHGWKLDLARAWGVKVLSEANEQLPSSSFPVTVEATGSPRGISEALRLVEPRGTLVMKSTFHGAANFDATKLVVDEVTLLGSRCGVFAPALELLRREQVLVQPLIAKTFPLELGREAFEYLDRTSALKVLLEVGSR
ncbi:MAG: alcohol dehydrogenase catalytic domain-containing protein [Acidobacteriota bacterium]|nr:alcohol dehydrogenase catalytic domain-containing protein [Acidobacteriota bacterium]